MSETVPIRDAATVVVTRQTQDGPAVLMGQRGAAAVFMPDKFVFPGGALDAADTDVPFARPLPAESLHRLDLRAKAGLGPALAACALRELWEETGLMIAGNLPWPGSAPEGWHDFAERGLAPDAGALSFIFRAITPPGSPRRFDARFFLVDADAIGGDPDDFSRSSDELRHLHWVPLDRARALNLPFITEIVLAEVAQRLAGTVVGPIPFFDNSGTEPAFRRLG